MLKGTFFSKLTRDSGFTLVELLVTLGIIGVFLGGGILNLRRLNQRQQVEGAARQVELIIRDTQKKASAGVKPAGVCVSPRTLKSYIVRISPPVGGVTNYRIHQKCDNDFEHAGTLTVLTRDIEIPGGAQLELDLLGRADTDYIICVRGKNGNYFFQVEVTTGGSIRTREVNSC